MEVDSFMEQRTAGKNKQRNGLIDLLRLYFTISVVMAHMDHLYFKGNKAIPFQHGNISVEFFFILSGLFMMVSYRKLESREKQQAGYATYAFLKHKAAALYPVWIVSSILSLIFYFFSLGKFSIVELVKALPGLLMISHIGFLEAHNVPFGWYIPIMLLGMAILFPVLYKFPKSFQYLIAPLIALFCAVFLFQRYGKIFALQEEWFLFFYPDLIRALCGLCLGCIAFTVSDKIRQWTGKLTVAGTALLSVLELACWAVPIIGLWGTIQPYMHLPIMLCFMMGTALTFSDLTWQGKMIHGPAFSWIGRVCYAIYLAQFLSKELTSCWIDPSNTGWFIAAYLSISVGGGLIIYYLAKLLSFLCRTIRSKSSHLLLKHPDETKETNAHDTLA